MAHMVHRGLSSCWGSWRTLVAERELMRLSGERLVERAALSAVVRWRERAALEASMRRALGHMLLSGLSRGFNRWACARDAAVAAAASLRRSVAHLVGHEVCRAWASWLAVCALHASRLASLRSMALHLLHRRLSSGLRAWCAMAATRRVKLESVRRAVTFMSHTQATRCWNAWAFEVRRRQRACAVGLTMGRVARHMMQRSLSRGLAGWVSGGGCCA